MNNFTPIDALIKKHNELKYGVSSGAKEAMPSVTPKEVQKNTEIAEDEDNTKEVTEYITPKKDDSISLPPDLKKAGMKTSSDADDQFKSAMYKIKFPISDEKILEDLKAKPTEAKRWYATLLLYILERSHLTIKKMGTKVVRLFKTS